MPGAYSKKRIWYNIIKRDKIPERVWIMNILYIVAYAANKTGWYSISTDFEYLKKVWLSYYLSGDKIIQQYTKEAI